MNAHLPLPEDDWPWRVGRKLGRTLYRQVGPEPSDDDILIGLLDHEDDAAEVVALRAALDAAWEQHRQEQEHADRLAEMLEKARDTFDDMALALTAIGHQTTAQACRIAQSATGDALAEHRARRQA